MEGRRRLLKNSLGFLLRFNELKEDLVEGVVRSVLASSYYRLPNPVESRVALNLDETLRRGVSCIEKRVGLWSLGCSVQAPDGVEGVKVEVLSSCEDVKLHYPCRILLLVDNEVPDGVVKCLEGLGYSEEDVVVLKCGERSAEEMSKYIGELVANVRAKGSTRRRPTQLPSSGARPQRG